MSMAIEQHTASDFTGDPQLMALRERLHHASRRVTLAEQGWNAAPDDPGMEAEFREADEALDDIVASILDARAQTLNGIRVKLDAAPYTDHGVVLRSIRGDLMPA